MNNKHDLREKMKTMRKNLDSEYVIKNSEIICKKIIGLQKYGEAKTILCYDAINNEVDLSYLIDVAKKDGKQIFFPKVISADTFILDPEADICPDLIIVPAVAIDRNFHRLGYGKGYFDRYLKTAVGSFKLGVCLDMFLLDDVFPENHDIALDAIMTEKNYFAK